MKLRGGSHLTYCTNVHPGETWPEVFANLERYLPAVRERSAHEESFGVGLRLSAVAARELAEPARLAELGRFLADNALYVFTLDGFPYGALHQAPDKELVYLPDWRDPARLEYANLLADLLARLLPAGVAGGGSVSTVPGAFATAVTSAADVERMRDHMVRHAAHLVGVERRTGRHVTLAIEPEPCCFVSTVEQAVEFFCAQLFADESVRQLAALTRLDEGRADLALRRHLALCLDLCHAAVEFEDVGDCLGRIAGAGIGIAKLQVSAGLRVNDFGASTVAELARFADPACLRQVVELGPDGLRHFSDLPEALASLAKPRAREAAREWRVHFHVPLFHDAPGALRSTRDFARDVLRIHRRAPVSRHLEVETYAWDVLPEAFRGMPVEDAIARELAWVRSVLAS